MIVIGTAGHIDHGKTSLVAGLTGIKTDRLKEEQERGISIELGFAYLDHTDGERFGLVDVPGHERFVRQMIAGATGIDLVVLVVAADEGVMQQTREHIDICSLLGIRHGAIVLTKTDLVDEEWLELVESDVADYVSETFLGGAPILHFAAPDKSTHGPVRDRLIELAKAAAAENASRGNDEPLRLPVDRVFTMKGFGTVVTGTVCSGAVGTGEAIEVLPSGHKTKIRGIQSHKQSVSQLTAGQRAAINLQGIEKEALHRGEVLTRPGSLAASRMLDVDLQLLKHVPRPMESQAKVLVHVGTSQATATVVLLDRDALEPGDTAPAQLRLDQFVVALGGDNFVLRGFDVLPTHGKTVGGGVILHPVAHKHKKDEALLAESLDALRSGLPKVMIEHAVKMSGQQGITEALIAQITHLPLKGVKTTAAALIQSETVYHYIQDATSHYIHQKPFRMLMDRAIRILGDYHQKFAHRAGIPKEELRSQVRNDLPLRYFAALVQALESEDQIVASGRLVQQRGFESRLTNEQQNLKNAIHARFQSAKLEPRPLDEIVQEITSDLSTTAKSVKEMTDLLIAEGNLHRVTESLVFAGDQIEWLERRVTEFLNKHGEMTTPQLKEITGTSRKFTVPLAEYLDARKVTIRIKEVRKLRRKSDTSP